MSRSLSLVLLGASLVAMSSCCCTERGPHAVRKMWADYNTLRCPAFYLEQEDHLPYPAAQVAYYRWMYDKDPGHQLACLGPIPPRACPNCDPVPPGNEPFEYEVAFPTGVPRQSDQLWGNKLPEPINLPGGPRVSEQSRGPGGLAQGPAKNATPVAPVVPPPLEPPKSGLEQQAPGAGNPADGARVPRTPSKLPTLDIPAPQARPLEENPAPLLGPESQQGPSLRLTTEQPLSTTETPPAPNAVWPR